MLSKVSGIPPSSTAVRVCDSPPAAAGSGKTSIRFPILVFSDRTDPERYFMTKNAEEMACISAAQMLRTAGIVDFPVFCVALGDQKVEVGQAWFSSANNVSIARSQ